MKEKSKMEGRMVWERGKMGQNRLSSDTRVFQVEAGEQRPCCRRQASITQAFVGMILKKREREKKLSR